MKKKIDKGPFIALVIFIVIIVAVSVMIMAQRNATRSDLAKRVAELGPENSNTPSTIEGLQEAIAIYENELSIYLNDVEKTGLYWKILATRLHDKKMYGDALNALDRAIEYYPSDPTLHYLKGVCFGQMAKASYGTQTQMYFDLAEEAYLKAINLDTTYSRPYYGLGVLYVYELNRAEEAVPYLERYAYQLRAYDVDALFVLAAAYYMSGNNEKAIAAYDDILSRTKIESLRAEATKNKQTILDGVYGQ
ncbi:MAG: tetratricopeptide repeat protein [Treponema sp.]|jgi:tetratricopeptide (TPR) repeat protein|nr:tetratricopeptide repeat protein [Treponema sp.]